MGSTPDLKFQSLAGNALPRVGLALQGGGTSGAYTDGVLRVLHAYFEKWGISVVGETGDSAGALNALYDMYGYITGKPGQKAEKANFMRERLWWSVDRMALLARHSQSLHNMFNPATVMGEMIEQAGHLFDMPRDAMAAFNLSGRHPALKITNMQVPPLQQMVAQHIDFKRFMDKGAPVVIINTTDKHNGQPKLYLNSALSAQAAAESGYLPRIILRMFDGNHPSLKTHDHDGGFTANPPVMPLYTYCPDMTDLIVVRITPLVQNNDAVRGLDEDKQMADKQLRYLYNAACEAELRAVRREAELEGRKLNIHVISVKPDWPYPMDTQASIKHTNWNFFSELRHAGAQRATEWLQNEGQYLGKQSTYEVGYQVFGQVAGSVPARNKLEPA